MELGSYGLPPKVPSDLPVALSYSSAQVAVNDVTSSAIAIIAFTVISYL